MDKDSNSSDDIYLTVTGLSCEAGDSGQVGRGNRVSGLISFMRPQTMEAWAGKNIKTHVGKIYSFVAQRLAKEVTEQIVEISEATVTLVGKIGEPVTSPPYIYCDFKVRGQKNTSLKQKVTEVLRETISQKKLFEPENLFIKGRLKINV